VIEVCQDRPQGTTDGDTNIDDRVRTVLIIDDDPYFSSILIDIARESGFTPIVAKDGRSGIVKATNIRPDAIILELGLPDIHGHEVLKTLKRYASTRDIPVQIVSIEDSDQKYLDAGAIAYIQKQGEIAPLEQAFTRFETLLPFSLKELLVVDDDRAIQDVVAAAVGDRHVKITRAMSGSEAFDKIVGKTYDCIILDWNLGDMTGLDLLDNLCARGSITLPPIVVYTGSELTAEDQWQLSKYSHNVIVKGPDSCKSLVEETASFLLRVENETSTEEPDRVEPDGDEPLLGKKILLVDDDARGRYALRCELEENGAGVVVAENGQIALDALDTIETFDLVVMDIMMPVMDGIEATARIRKHALYCDIPLIALTALSTRDEKKKCMDAGADGFLTKPIVGDELVKLAVALTKQEQKAN